MYMQSIIHTTVLCTPYTHAILNFAIGDPWLEFRVCQQQILLMTKT